MFAECSTSFVLDNSLFKPIPENHKKDIFHNPLRVLVKMTFLKLHSL